MEVKQRHQLQKMVLPEGVIYDKTKQEFGTAVLSPIIGLNQGYSGDKSQLVAGTGFEPATARL